MGHAGAALDEYARTERRESPLVLVIHCLCSTWKHLPALGMGGCNARCTHAMHVCRVARCAASCARCQPAPFVHSMLVPNNIFKALLAARVCGCILALLRAP
eukprot:894229-Rhodomonas_salina.1